MPHGLQARATRPVSGAPSSDEQAIPAETSVPSHAGRCLSDSRVFSLRRWSSCSRLANSDSFRMKVITSESDVALLATPSSIRPPAFAPEHPEHYREPGIRVGTAPDRLWWSRVSTPVGPSARRRRASMQAIARGAAHWQPFVQKRRWHDGHAPEPVRVFGGK
jgi:hypothetical protein